MRYYPISLFSIYTVCIYQHSTFCYVANGICYHLLTYMLLYITMFLLSRRFAESSLNVL